MPNLFSRPNTHQKALEINLDPLRYGTFAEIGAGQEVVRWFFRVGGAAGTVAKSISAYDMAVSDAIYGKCSRYVCRERLEAMLNYEQELNRSRLGDARGDETAFFTFADTVSARNYRGTNYCHGWMGVRFQVRPHAPVSQVIIHVRMRDREATLQQEALSHVGVNLLYGAFNFHETPSVLVESLLDDLSTDRIEVDMIEFSGDAFREVDNRVMSLELVQLGLSRAALFSSYGEVLQPSEVFYKRPILAHRGRFRPVTRTNVDIIERALERFTEDTTDARKVGVQVMEMTMADLTPTGEVDLEDFVARADVLSACGVAVLVSNYTDFHSLTAYLSQFTSELVGIAMGAGTLVDRLEGESADPNGYSVARLLHGNVKLYVYPYRAPTGDVVTAANLRVGPQKLYEHFLDAGLIEGLTGIDETCIDILSPEVLRMIGEGDEDWQELVPEEVAQIILSRGYFQVPEAVV